MYVMTVQAPIAQLHFTGNLKVSDLIVDNHRLYSVLRPNWNAGSCALRVRHLSLELPSLVPIAFYKRK